MSISLAAIGAAFGYSGPTQAGLLLDTTVTGSFTQSSTNAPNNDLPGHPNPFPLAFGQLASNEHGFVDFYFLGNEAGYTNTLLLNGTQVHSTAGLQDNFNPSFSKVGSPLEVFAGSLLNFGFCTDGGDSVSVSGVNYGKCAFNNDAASLTAQFNYGGTGAGYRSIAFRPLTNFDPTTGAVSFGSSPISDTWAIFWDDSGASNDDDFDDYIAVASLKTTSVPEPGTALLLGTGLLGALIRRRRNRSS